MLTCRKQIRGFTLVEAVIVLAVIAALLAVLIPVMRERERERLQALAKA
ncbi:MAG: prepilin-type N-terminal cleavage/methylation domain-containing protein [Candidatus Hydrogenedentes bacterium]|jgi:prepilin-type N-terminal cleavage/methylation domain-containing protein|nr:prepilin-type N-terminal cleavage/methylation domain-containing protein [Candidatus Hydrogenedentota bacterium]